MENMLKKFLRNTQLAFRNMKLKMKFLSVSNLSGIGQMFVFEPLDCEKEKIWLEQFLQIFI